VIRRARRSWWMEEALADPALQGEPTPPMAGDLTRTLGESILTRFVLPFELLALLMLAAMLGAVYFARPED